MELCVRNIISTRNCGVKENFLCPAVPIKIVVVANNSAFAEREAHSALPAHRKTEQDLPQQITIDCVESLCKVDEGNKKVTNISDSFALNLNSITSQKSNFSLIISTNLQVYQRMRFGSITL